MKPQTVRALERKMTIFMRLYFMAGAIFTMMTGLCIWTIYASIGHFPLSTAFSSLFVALFGYLAWDTFSDGYRYYKDVSGRKTVSADGIVETSQVDKGAEWYYPGIPPLRWVRINCQQRVEIDMDIDASISAGDKVRVEYYPHSLYFSSVEKLHEPFFSAH